MIMSISCFNVWWSTVDKKTSEHVLDQKEIESGCQERG